MNTPEEKYITYVMVDKSNTNPDENQKRVKIINTPEEERITHIAIEPAKAGKIQSTNNPQITANYLGSSGNLEKVRDLLFGNQVREFEKKFNRLEERLLKECSTLRDDTKKRLDSLEMYITQEAESLTEGLKTEQIERDEAVKDLGQNLKDTTKSLEKKVSQLDEQTSQKQRELRQQILDQSKSLDDDMRQKYEAIMTVIERETQELRTDKTDRSTLAALLTQLAMQLTNEYEISSNG